MKRMKLKGFHSEQPFCDCKSCKNIRKYREEGIEIEKFKKIVSNEEWEEIQKKQRDIKTWQIIGKNLKQK